MTIFRDARIQERIEEISGIEKDSFGDTVMPVNSEGKQQTQEIKCTCVSIDKICEASQNQANQNLYVRTIWCIIRISFTILN